MATKRDPLRFFRKLTYTSGELSRIRQFVRESGRMLLLPYDQFIEHDCRHLEAGKFTGDPDYIIQLGMEGGYNAVVVHYGIARRFWSRYDGQIPLIVKINGKTSIPSEAKPLSVHTSFVEDAIRIGAVGIGYTMYYGSPRQDEDFLQLAKVRADCERFGIPLIIWAYPRGEGIDEKGGRDSNYALESAARLAMEMGTTIIKSNEPKDPPKEFLDNKKIPSYYRDLERELAKMDEDERQYVRMQRVVEAAQGVPVLFSGGSKISDDDLLKKAEQAIKCGSIGFIFGRNMWQRKKEDALNISKRLIKILDAE